MREKCCECPASFVILFIPSSYSKRTTVYPPACNGGVPDESGLLAVALVHVAIHRVVAQWQLTARKPFGKRRAGILQHALPPPRPNNLLGRRGPVLFRLMQRCRQLGGIAAGIRGKVVRSGRAAATATGFRQPQSSPPEVSQRHASGSGVTYGNCSAGVSWWLSYI